MTKGSVGSILHSNAVRLRVTGSGTLDLYLRSLNGINNLQLNSLTMANTTDREPIITANFKNQRIQLELTTTEIGEEFNVSKIVIFVKAIAEGYPVGV